MSRGHIPRTVEEAIALIRKHQRPRSLHEIPIPSITPSKDRVLVDRSARQIQDEFLGGEAAISMAVGRIFRHVCTEEELHILIYTKEPYPKYVGRKWKQWCRRHSNAIATVRPLIEPRLLEMRTKEGGN